MAYNELFDKISWSVDQAPETAHLDETEQGDPANQAMLNAVAFDGAKEIILVPNIWAHGDGPVIHIPAGATILQVLTAIADDYQKRPMTDNEFKEQGLHRKRKARKDRNEGKSVYRIEIMGAVLLFEGFEISSDPNVLHLCLGIEPPRPRGRGLCSSLSSPMSSVTRQRGSALGGPQGASSH